jgi:RNA polymerase sigma factor (sigma-70 family)
VYLIDNQLNIRFLLFILTFIDIFLNKIGVIVIYINIKIKIITSMTTIQFSTLYNKHYDALLNFAKQLTRNHNDAEDLVQDTAIKAMKGLHTYRIGSNFRSWAFTILKNTFINNYHRKKRRGVVNKPVEEFIFALENKHALLNNGLSKLYINDIEDKINALTETCRIPFLMHTRGYQYKEISDSLSIPIGTVKSRINYARTKLKPVLAKQYRA